MTDPSELIARLSIYEGLGELPSLSIHPDMGGYSTGGLYGDARDAAAMIRALAAERDAALTERDTAMMVKVADAALDAKPAAPESGMVRVRIPVSVYGNGSMSILWSRYSDGGQSSLIQSKMPVVTITADIPVPQPAEITGTVEVSDG